MVIKSDMGDALFTKTQQRVLGFLFGDIDRSYYLNELVGLVGMGKGTVRRELDKLHVAGIIRARKVGNQLHYQANPDSPIFGEIRNIVKKTTGLASLLMSALDACLSDLELAFVYGSVAKGTEQAGSDIDLMLVGENLNFSDVLKLLLPAAEQLGREINPTILSPAEFKERIGRGQSFLARVLAQDKIWLHGEGKIDCEALGAPG